MLTLREYQQLTIAIRAMRAIVYENDQWVSRGSILSLLASFADGTLTVDGNAVSISWADKTADSGTING